MLLLISINRSTAKRGVCSTNPNKSQNISRTSSFLSAKGGCARLPRWNLVLGNVPGYDQHVQGIMYLTPGIRR